MAQKRQKPEAVSIIREGKNIEEGSGHHTGFPSRGFLVDLVCRPAPRVAIPESWKL